MSAPTTFSVELGEAVCELIAEGCLLNEIAKRPGMPSRATMWRWRMMHPDFNTRFAEARMWSAEALEDKALELVAAANTPAEAATARHKAAVLMWAAEKRNPRVYGGRMVAEPSPSGVDARAMTDAELEAQVFQVGRGLGFIITRAPPEGAAATEDAELRH